MFIMALIALETPETKLSAFYCDSRGWQDGIGKSGQTPVHGYWSQPNLQDSALRFRLLAEWSWCDSQRIQENPARVCICVCLSVCLYVCMAWLQFLIWAIFFQKGFHSHLHFATAKNKDEPNSPAQFAFFVDYIFDTNQLLFWGMKPSLPYCHPWVGTEPLIHDPFVKSQPVSQAVNQHCSLFLALLPS